MGKNTFRCYLAVIGLAFATANWGAAQDSVRKSELLSPYLQAAHEKWEADIVKFEEQDRKLTEANDAILFIGSSSLRLWKDLATDLAPRHVINRGYGGAKFSDLAVYVNRLVKPHACQAVVIFVANDIVGKSDDKSSAEVAELFKFIVEQVRATHPKQPIFLIAITPTPLRFEAWPKIREANAALEKVCNALPELYFISTEKHYLDANGKPLGKYFGEDRLHQNRDGYQLWGSLVAKRLDEVLGSARE